MLTFSVFGLVASAKATAAGKDCQEWNAKVDPSIHGKIAADVAHLPDKAVMKAIDCLLGNQGNRENALIGGVTDDRVSMVLPQATVELASLYYVSYLFTGNYRHGDGIALWDRKGGINPPGGIETAYASYRAWFKKVKSVGLAEARKQHLDPLEGTNLHWYGK